MIEDGFDFSAIGWSADDENGICRLKPGPKQLQIDIRIISKERKLEGKGVRRPCLVYMLFFFLLFFFGAILRTVESRRRTDVA
jgi:hypothetical protein